LRVFVRVCACVGVCKCVCACVHMCLKDCLFVYLCVFVCVCVYPSGITETLSSLRSRACFLVGCHFISFCLFLGHACSESFCLLLRVRTHLCPFHSRSFGLSLSETLFLLPSRAFSFAHSPSLTSSGSLSLCDIYKHNDGIDV